MFMAPSGDTSMAVPDGMLLFFGAPAVLPLTPANNNIGGTTVQTALQHASTDAILTRPLPTACTPSVSFFSNGRKQVFSSMVNIFSGAVSNLFSTMTRFSFSKWSFTRTLFSFFGR
uniref:Uncharacterized protein n=1 Tax=Cacopsylla melanoneura TaxID=428564 RepID=A0A8D9A3J0_9HEMI